MFQGYDLSLVALYEHRALVERDSINKSPVLYCIHLELNPAICVDCFDTMIAILFLLMILHIRYIRMKK